MHVRTAETPFWKRLPVAHAWAIGSRGEAYAQLGRYDDAITDLTRAIELKPDYAWAIAGRGHVYRLAGRHEEALADINRALGLREDDDWDLYQRALVRCWRGDREAADQDIAAAIRLVAERLAAGSASGSDAYNIAVYRGASGDLAQARDDLARAIERFPDVPLIRDAVDDLRDLGDVPGMDAAGIAGLIEFLDALDAAAR